MGAFSYSISPNSLNEFGEEIHIRMGYDVLITLDNPENFFALNNHFINADININGLLFQITPLFSDFWELVRLSRTIQINVESLVLIISLLTTVISIVSTTILLNSRKYEIAVLRSNGMKKTHLIIGYLIENLVFIWSIAIVSLIAAQFIAPLFTSGTFEGIRELVSPEMFEQLTQGGNITLILQNAAWVFGGATAVVALSLAIACINIVRFEPLKIFNKQY